MPERSIDEVLDLLRGPVEPDADFELRLRVRVAAELRGETTAVDPYAPGGDDSYGTSDLAEIEAARSRRANGRARWWRPVAAAAAAATVAAGIVSTFDDPRPSTTTASARTFSTATLTEIDVDTVAPYFVAVAGDAWVASLAGQLVRIDRRTGDVLDRATIPDSSAIAVDHRAVWVADAVTGEVLRLDLQRADVVARIPTGIEVLELTVRVPMRPESSGGRYSVIGGITTNGSSVWVGDRAGRVLRIDPGANEIAATFPVAVRPDHLRADGDRLLVANLRSGQAAVVDATSGSEVTTVDAGEELAGAVLHGGALYTQRESDGVVTRVDLESGARTTSGALGASFDLIGQHTLPAGLVVTDAGVLVDTSSEPHSLHVLDPITLAELGTLAVGADHGDLAVAPDGSAWLARMSDGTVVRITPGVD